MKGAYQAYKTNVRNRFKLDRKQPICRARGRKIIKKLKKKFNSLLHLQLSRGIVDAVKEKWYHFKFNPSYFKEFANSLCEVDEVPDDPVFGVVSNVTTVAEEMCEIGIDCNEDGSSILPQGMCCNMIS